MFPTFIFGPNCVIFRKNSNSLKIQKVLEVKVWVVFAAIALVLVLATLLGVGHQILELHHSKCVTAEPTSTPGFMCLYFLKTGRCPVHRFSAERETYCKLCELIEAEE